MTTREIKGIKISRAKPDQASTLTPIAFAAKRHWGYPERWIEIWSPILTVSSEFIKKHDTYAAYVKREPVGFYALSVNENKASLEHLWVLPDHLGTGIGKALFEHALSRCGEIGVDVLEIESDPNAQGFYERMGAKKTGEIVSELDGELRVLPLLEIELWYLLRPS
jgi:GNAT superfamily N-acetyltransferase